eukprot:172298_1
MSSKNAKRNKRNKRKKNGKSKVKAVAVVKHNNNATYKEHTVNTEHNDEGEMESETFRDSFPIDLSHIFRISNTGCSHSSDEDYECNKDLIDELHNKDKELSERRFDVKRLNIKCKQLQDKVKNQCIENKEMHTKYKKQQILIQSMKKQCKVDKSMKQKYDQLICKLDRLQIEYKNILNKYNELQIKYDKQQMLFGYLNWNAIDIANWIVNINKKKYNIYYDNLVKNMENEEIDGECLNSLDKHDLCRLGISKFKDRRDIMVSINELIIHNEKNKELETKCNELQKICNEEIKNKECAICMDKRRIYACVPCGHLCLCSKCKNSTNKKCPVCRKENVTHIQIYF